MNWLKEVVPAQYLKLAAFALCALIVTGCATPQALTCPLPPTPPDALMTAPSYPLSPSKTLESQSKTPTK